MSDNPKHEWDILNNSKETKIELLDNEIPILKPITLLEDGTRFILVYLATKISDKNKESSMNNAYFAIKHPDGRKELTPVQKLSSDYSCNVLKTWEESRWHVKDIKEWLYSSDVVESKQVYKLIDELSRIHFDYQTEADYVFFNLWNIGTYFYQLFDSYPYIDYAGTKRSGKTKNQTFHTIVCYNAVSTADISESALFRLIEGIGATISIDEFENSSNLDRKRIEQIKPLLKSGFIKDQHAIRNEERDGNYIPKQYDLYAPKNLAHIDGFDDVLEDRCVEIVILRSTDSKILNSWPDSDTDTRFTQLRHLCYRLFLDYAEEVKNLIEEAKGNLNVTSRELMIWTPIMTLALFFEKHGIEGLIESIQEKVKKSNEERNLTDEEDSLDIKVLRMLDEHVVNEAEKSKDWIQHSKIYSIVKKVAANYGIDVRIFSEKCLSKVLKRLGFVRKRVDKGVNWLLDRKEVDKAKVRMGLIEPTEPTQTTPLQTKENVVNEENVVNAREEGLNITQKKKGDV